MKFYFLFSVLLFISTHLNSQITEENNPLSFKELYERATDDYENEVINSPYYDKALEVCPDVKKYPNLLTFKGMDLFDSKQNVLAIKYLKLAKLYITDEEDNLNITFNLALAYEDMKQNKEALYYFKETHRRAEEMGNEFYKSESYFSILIYEFLNPNTKFPFTKFWDFYNNLKEKTKDDKFLILNTIFEISNEEKLLNEATKIRNYIYKNFTLDSMSNGNLSFFHSNIANLSIGLKEFTTALKHNDTSYQFSKKLGLNDILAGLIIYKKIYAEKNDLELALKYVDSIQLIEDKLKKINNKSSLEIVDENFLFNKTKKKTENKLRDYKTIIIGVCLAAIILLILFILWNKKLKSKFQNLNSEFRVHKGKYNKSLKENLTFKKDIKELLKSKKFDEISKLHKVHEINDINNDTYIEYLASEIENTFLNSLKKHTFTFSDIEKVVLFYRKNNHTYKEIALITGRSLRSIQSLSYRLNKKIQMKTGLELLDFLKKI